MDIIKELRKYFDTNTGKDGGTLYTTKDYFKHLELKIQKIYESVKNDCDNCKKCVKKLCYLYNLKQNIESIIKDKQNG